MTNTDKEQFPFNGYRWGKTTRHPRILTIARCHAKERHDLGISARHVAGTRDASSLGKLCIYE
jgi:hypothetical protein